MTSRLCLLLVIHTGLGAPALCHAQAGAGAGARNAPLIARQSSHLAPGRCWPSLQELHAPFADILVPPSAVSAGAAETAAQSPAQPLARAVALEKLRQVEALRPGFRLPRPVLLPQVVRFINAELARQKVSWRLALALAASAPPARGAAAVAAPVVFMDGGVSFTVQPPPPAEQLLVDWHEGLLEYALPEPPAFVEALAEGSVGSLILALAETVPATVTFEAGAAGGGGDGGRVVLTPWLPQGRPPLGERRPGADLQKLYADVLYPTPGQLKKGVDPGSFHGRAQELRAVLRALQPAPPLPRPVLLPQVLRHVNAELARQQAPYRVLFQPSPHEWEDASVYYDETLCRVWNTREFRDGSPSAVSEGLSIGNLYKIVMNLDSSRRWPEILTLLPAEGAIVVQSRFEDSCVIIDPFWVERWYELFREDMLLALRIVLEP